MPLLSCHNVRGFHNSRVLLLGAAGMALITFTRLPSGWKLLLFDPPKSHWRFTVGTSKVRRVSPQNIRRVVQLFLPPSSASPKQWVKAAVRSIFRNLSGAPIGHWEADYKTFLAHNVRRAAQSFLSPPGALPKQWWLYIRSLKTIWRFDWIRKPVIACSYPVRMSGARPVRVPISGASIDTRKPTACFQNVWYTPPILFGLSASNASLKKYILPTLWKG